MQSKKRQELNPGTWVNGDSPLILLKSAVQVSAFLRDRAGHCSHGTAMKLAVHGLSAPMGVKQLFATTLITPCHGFAVEAAFSVPVASLGVYTRCRTYKIKSGIV